MNETDLTGIGVAAAAKAIAEGAISSEDLVRACLDRIAECDGEIEAWAFLDPEHALAQARAADLARREGRTLGPLHGVPVGVKDIFDTADMPTEYGSALHAGRRPADDASAVAQLREAGAVILGKTVTTPFALYHPGKTRNPHDPARTPGGSSSGSAAAVAAHMAPVAVGSQTNGSVIRPAAFCGVLGFKPTHGLISREHMLAQSRTLDQVGVFGRSVEDVAITAQAMMGFDHRDPDMRLRARPDLVGIAATEPPIKPNLALVRTPVWDQADESTKAAFAELVEVLGDWIEEVTLPVPFDEAHALHRTIMEAEIARGFADLHESGADAQVPGLAEMIDRGGAYKAVDYLRAVEGGGLLADVVDGLFERYDALITPAAPGVAPRGLETTGSPAFCTIWTLCGAPTLTLPVMADEAGLPLGVQLVGKRGDDARLLRTARWLFELLAE